MSAKPKKVDPNYVSQRVLQTKKEIEQLKLELEKLINRGIDADKANSSTIIISDDRNEIRSNESKNVLNIPLHSSAQRNPNVTKKPSSTFIPKKDFKKEETSTEVSPKKVRHYDVEEAREYMRKQKEKRMEKMKIQMQASQNVIDIRKEKLKELQKRSLELVQKNITLKRERSRSREKKTLPEKEIAQKDFKMNMKLTSKKQETNMKNTSDPTNNCKDNINNRVPDLIVNNTEEVPAVCSIKDQNVQTEFDFKNICIRNNTEHELVPFDSLVKQNTDIQHKAALKIQSCYRRYRQQQIFKNILKSKKKKFNNMLKNIKPVLNTENPKPIAEKPAQNNVPFWLQTVVEPYPYNFISAVKKKLNLATNAPVKSSSDIGVQISIEEPEKVEIFKTPNEIRKAITESLKETGSFTSHKCLDLNLANVKELHLCDEKLHNSNNDCDIHRHSDDNIPTKPTHSKLKPVKQASDTSESDTSKNIPDISSESSVSTIHSKKHLETDSSEYKLNINVDKLKNLKLQERTLNAMENTKLILSNNRHKEEKILLNEVPQINEYKDISKKSKISGNIQENLGSSTSLKLKHILRPSVTESKHSKSAENIRSESIKDIFYQKSDAKSNNSNSVISQQMSKSETHISAASDLNKLSKKSSNLILVKSCRSETNVPKLLNQEKLNKDLHNDIESDDNLKSFLEYMTSLEDSKKSRSLQKRSSSHRTSNSFKTLPSKSEKISESVADNIKTDKENSSVENYSTNFSNSAASTTSSVPLLQCPSITLTTSERAELPLQTQNRNSISIKPGEIKCIETKTNTNQIHLKFEAELHLLNDFNESLRQFMAVEKSLIELHGTNQSNIKIHQNQDTQTTAPLPPTTLKKPDDTIDTATENSQLSEKTMPTINYERGSDIMEENDKTLEILKNLQDDIKNLNVEEDVQQEICHYSNKDDNSVLMGLELSQLNEAINSTIDVSMSNTSAPDVSFNSNVYVGFSVGMFDQLIRDEDARIENLKTILKIREKALLDRTKGELAWLEIQKKQLIETGQLHEASLLKKKQRGIIIKLQHEKQEMQRLKQIQKAASRERKTILKEQRNMIKAQLSNSNAVPKIRRSVYKERRHLGPVKVYNLHRETINTETSISRRSSLAEEIIITSRSESIVGQISEEGPGDHDTSMILNTSFKGVLNKRNEEAKKSLLMREAALQKRKKAAEELLQWHQRLLEEERKIAELEMAANTIIKQVPVHVGDSLCKGEDEKYDFKGSQLNFLWTNMTGRDEKKFKDDERYSLNQITLEKFCTDAKKNLIEKKRHLDKIEKTSTSSNSSVKSIDDLIKDKSDSDGHTVLESAIIEDIKSDNDSTETEGRKSISNGDKCYQSQDNTYSYSFESDALEVIDENVFVEEKNEANTIKSNADVLVNEIDRSKSTLSEIMQNISNITDEISAIYKLSSVANTIKDESVHSNVNTDNVEIRTKVTDSYIIRKDSDDIPQRDESEDDTLKSSVQSEIVKSLTELISSQNACQDIKFEQKHNIIETPESVRSKNTLTDSQGTLTSNIELCINSNKLEGETNKTVTNDIESAVSLNTDLNKELPREDAVVKDSFISVAEQEEITDSSKTKAEVISVSKASGDVINDLRTESNNQSVMTKVCSVNDTSNAIKNNAITTIEESQNNEISENNTSKSDIRNMLDLSYGFTGVRTNKHETISSISEINTSMKGETNITNELPIENGFNNFDHKISDKTNSKENSCLPVAEVLNKSLVITEDENKCELETNIKNNSTSDKLISKLALNSIRNDSLNIDLNKSNEETTISTESGFEKSVDIEECNYANEDDEKRENNLKNINDTKLSSPEKINESIIGSNTKNSYDVSITNEINEEKSCVDNLLLDDVNNSSKDIKCSSVSENIDDNLKLITSPQNGNIKSESLNESDIQDEEDISDLSNKSLDNTSEELSSDNDREKLVLNLEKLYDIEDSKSMITKKENANNLVDVKKRVSEILADTTSAREDKSPRLQDIYTTTYDVLSPEHSPETGSPANNGRNIASVTQLYDEEAEALFKKQLAIEQEIKQLEQQQKEHIPYIYMREIPNKPPPPYTPPTSQIHVSTVLPSSVEQLQCMTSIISDRLFKAYISGNLETATPNITEELKLLTRHNIDKDCFEFIYDLCKEFAVEHYKQFVEYSGPSWMAVNKRSLAKRKPFDGNDLKAYLFKKTKEILEFEKVIFKEKMITKWSRKKRDHVDEILVIESQTEESEWTNYDDDEVIVKNELTNDIMNMLLTETANVISKIFNKKMNLS